MKGNRITKNLQFSAGVLTWFVVAAITLKALLESGGRGVFSGTLEPYLALVILNLAAMLSVDAERFSLRVRWLAHMVQGLTAFTMGMLLPFEWLQIFTIIWLAMATGFYSQRVCFGLLALVMTTWYLIYSLHWYDPDPILPVALFGTFHMFALLMSRTATAAEEARVKTQDLYRELVATQHLLSEASRQSERTRIARDLHDLVGHHLTALSINLQIAERQTEGEAQERVAQSRALARLLLSDVREAVSTLREQSALDFRRALQLMVDEVPRLDVRLEIDEDVEIDDVDVADTIIRCVQEAITNTLRHSGAAKSWVRVWREGEAVRVSVRDDGYAPATIDEGNGFVGMRERLERVGGSLTRERVGNALSLNVEIPLPGH
ncbi:MAG: histidine kinase [Pseudomonadota bacterium]